MPNIVNRICALAACAGLSAATAAIAAPAGALEHTGMCDASAAVAVGGSRFVVANDEDNVLRLYSSTQSGTALATFIIPSLPVLPGVKHGEADIEGAARIGKRIYWIASHGSNSSAKARPHRRQLFATDIDMVAGKFTLTQAGHSFADLLAAMDQYDGLKKFKLQNAAQIAPEGEGGLNIEGLAAMPNGALLIGLRNPLSGGKALLITLENPEKVLGIGGAKAAPVFGKPIELALGGLGIRSIEYAESLKTYLIVAGSHGSGGAFKVFKWSGTPEAVPELLKTEFKGSFRPEALYALDDGQGLRVLSDDGDEQLGSGKCKDAAPGLRKFRSMDLLVAGMPDQKPVVIAPVIAAALAPPPAPATAAPTWPAAAPNCTKIQDKPFANETVRLGRAAGLDGAANFAVFKAPLAVNTDGAPTSYHPDDYTGIVKAINHLDNAIVIRATSGKKMRLSERRAVFDQWRKSPQWQVPTGYSITWKNVIAKDPQGYPCIFKQENAGYFGSLTALNNGLSGQEAGECMVRNQLDQRIIPAIVLRGKDNPLHGYGAKKGDLVLVTNPANGVVVSAVIGDAGNGDRIGEGSIALNMALLGLLAQPASYAEAVKFDTGTRAMIVAVLPASAGYKRERPHTAANIRQRVAQWSMERGYGGVDKLAAAASACAADL